MVKRSKKDDSRFICKCECGGNVRGVEEFDRLWTWCEKCSPVTVITVEMVHEWNRWKG